ncbi:hypothetical protein ACFOOK_28260 [Micromonospora krabiensis]|uniref:Uncharacterized protein n=1 Tax=Micromonospora krabiensis TaxID=307121 RepID=A0A1C3N4R8_9ACTN|nr:hypothetical protein [Micromonospora krabiensis]SBV27536.1 hypothetical protein GA0070620_3060 [Micromonospora krabiensis]
MTTNDIDAIRAQALTDEPGNNAFVVWYDPNREPYAVYFRSDANAWGDQRWFNADQHHSGGTEPGEWHELCDELYGNDGPHLLVPGHEVEKLRAERDQGVAAMREELNRMYAADMAKLRAALTESRTQAATLATEVGRLTADNARLVAERDAAVVRIGQLKAAQEQTRGFNGRSPAPGQTARCGVDGCEGKRVARGYCAKHYTRFRRTGDPLGVLPGSHEARGPAACGSREGEKRHRRNGEKPCDPCRDAAAVALREWRRRKRAEVAR